MKRKLILIAICLLTAVNTLVAQTQYQSINDSQHPASKILKGVISREIIKNDSAYKWYAANEGRNAHTDNEIIKAFEKHKDSVSFIVFGGTWCEDTQFILPKFFLLQEKAGITDDHTTLFAVDRQKQTIANLSAAFNIKNVPTIIVMKDGKEIGRVVEYGKTGKWDKELADILNY
jgi:thiol-disulfide isomerase/thioredoxin